MAFGAGAQRGESRGGFSFPLLFAILTTITCAVGYAGAAKAARPFACANRFCRGTEKWILSVERCVGFYHGPAQLDAWCRGPGPHLGHYGNGRVYHLPHSGRGRPDGGRQPWHGRRGVCAAGAERLPGVGGHGGRRGCGHAGGHGHGPAAHRVRNSAHFGGHFDTAGAVFGEPARDGLWHGRRQGEPACQRGQIRPFGQRALCARGGALEPHFCAGAGGGHCDRVDVLVFRHRERLFAARPRAQTRPWPGPRASTPAFPRCWG